MTRDERIVREVVGRGRQYREVGAEHGIGHERVRQIVQRENPGFNPRATTVVAIEERCAGGCGRTVRRWSDEESREMICGWCRRKRRALEPRQATRSMRAYRLRAMGWGYFDIARELGYRSEVSALSAARTAASRFGWEWPIGGPNGMYIKNRAARQ